MKSIIYSIVCMALVLPSIISAQGFRITVEAPGCTEDALYLAYYLGNRQYVQDTAVRQGDTFIFQGDEPLDAGFYLVVFPPDNQYFQLLIDDGPQDIGIQTDITRIQRPESVRGSAESAHFYEYVDFVSSRRPEAESLRKAIETSAGTEKVALEAKLEALNREVEDRQLQEISKRPGSLTSLLIAANREVRLPDFEGTEDEVNEQRFHYYREHYFDNIPLDDERIVRTPFLHEKIDHFINKLTVQTPDSLTKTIDMILSRMDPGGDVFKIYLVHFLNEYAKSKIVGMDAVYVHIAQNYYGSGMAPWTDEEQLRKIVQNAQRLEPILIGKVAPNIILQDADDNNVELHKINSPLTVMYFWAPDCGHCKKSIPRMIEFYESYKDKGVEILAICTKLKDEVSECWEAIEERGMGIWLNAVDPFLRSRYKQIYDVRTTPRIFVLDEEKKILMKNIGSEQLPGIIDHLLEQQQ